MTAGRPVCPELLRREVPHLGVDAFSRLVAAVTLNGYGLISAFAGVYGLFGSMGTGR